MFEENGNAGATVVKAVGAATSRQRPNSTPHRHSLLPPSISDPSTAVALDTSSHSSSG